ncbi:hypothetical protein SB659_20160, partial [Arthrobacter sp. SIMBA_036]|uniref:hypothetical protein n=1 Tax=Arthrobacter sp. SIMBA_036 TaxID=3085778 RepID=UPI00397A86C0
MRKENALEIAGKQAAEFAEDFGSWGSYMKEKGLTFMPSIKSESGGKVLIGDESYETLKPIISSLYTQENLQRVISFKALRDL